MPRKKQPLIGEGMNANLLKQFIDYSYLGNTSIAPEGYSIDTPLSDSRVKVYTKNGSNDKNVVVTHRGSVGADDWLDNARYAVSGKVKGTKTYNLHRERHKKAVEKYGAKNIIAIGHSRAGLYLQELQKEFPIKENITYNKASGFHDIGRENDANQTDIRVGNDVVSLLAPLQKRPTNIVKIDGTKNPLDFNTAHQTSELDKLGTTFIGKKEEEEPKLTGLKPIVALRPDKPKPNPTAMLNYGKNNLTGEGITPRISSEHRIRKLLGVEERRLKRMRDGTTKYKSKYITESKTLEKISRLKKRLASAEANEGQATETFFIPKTEKWLKITKNDTYLNTPLKEDGRHQQMVSEIDRTIAELKANKKKQSKAENKPITITLSEKKAEEIKAVVKEEVKKAEEAIKVETKKVKIKDLTKEEQLARKKEYDRLRYLKIKAKALEAQATETETPKQVAKLKKAVVVFKEEVKDLVDDVEDEDDEEDPISKVKADYLKKYKATKPFSRNAIPEEQIDHIKKFVKYDFLIKELKEELVKSLGFVPTLINWDKSKVREIAQLIAEDSNDKLASRYKLYANPKKEGSGFNKKQLTKIILDKNKVIADLEETAYGGMIHPEAEDVFDTFEGRIKRKVTKPKKVSKKNLKQQEGYDDEFDTITKRRQDEEIEELMRRGTQRREAQRQDDEAERRRYDEANNLIWDIIRPYNLQRGTENMRNFWLMIEMIREENDIVEVPTSYVKRFVEGIVNEGDDSRFDVMSFNLNPRDDSRGDDDTEPTIGSGIHNQYSYLDNIINNDTTSQNVLIHSYKSKPKYIKSLVD
jgi:hypothetical protein